MAFASSPSLPPPNSLDASPRYPLASSDTNQSPFPNSRSIKNIPPALKLPRHENHFGNQSVTESRRPSNEPSLHTKPTSPQHRAHKTSTALPTAQTKLSPCDTTASPHHLAIHSDSLKLSSSRQPVALLSKRSESSPLIPSEPSPASPHASVQMHPQAFDKSKYDALTPNSRSLRTELDQSNNLALPAPRPRPRHSVTAPPANRYSSYVPPTRLSSYIDESRLVTGVLESALPPSARPSPPSRPARTMSITQLDQRHRLALQRLQKPASALITCQSNDHSAPPLPTAKPIRARKHNRKPSTPSPPVPCVPRGDGMGNAAGKPAKSTASAAHPQVDFPRPAPTVSDASEPAKENVKPKRWRIFKFFSARGAFSQSPPKPSRATTAKPASRTHTAPRVPARILSGETSSEQVDEIIPSDSDSDVIPLAQLRPQLIMRASASSATSSTFNSRELPMMRQHSSSSLKPLARPRNSPASNLAAHRMSMMSSSVHHHSKKPSSAAIGAQGQARPTVLLPGETRHGSISTAQKNANRSSAWLDY